MATTVNKLTPQERKLIREYLHSRFNLIELKTLAFDLGLDYNDIGYRINFEFSQELILWCERSSKIPELLSLILSQRRDPEIARILSRFEGGQELVNNIVADFLKGPMENPYVGHSGRPVAPPNFVGREDIIEQIHKLWQNKGQLPPIILYGHRRMGKTSTLRNLNAERNPKILLVLIDMQDAGLVDNTGQLFYQFARSIHQKATLAGLQVGSTPLLAQYATTGQARLQLNALLETMDAQMQDRRLILAVDEFEIIQNRIIEGKIEAQVLDYLRAINQRFDWLGLIFAGLHELEEMGHDYQSAFFGSAKHLKVSYLKPDMARRLITQRGNRSFRLEYDPELVDALYNLTYGQPYLIQLLCWQLVEQWNERAEPEPDGIPPRLTLSDLDTVLNERFFDDADYYFDGVWGQIGETERHILKAIANPQYQNGFASETRSQPKGLWTRLTQAINVRVQDEVTTDKRRIIPRLSDTLGNATATVSKATLKEQSHLTDDGLSDALKNLKRRDLVTEQAGQISFASEIMRRWVIREMQRQREAALANS